MGKTGAAILIIIGIAGLWLYNTGRLGGVWKLLSSPQGTVVLANAPTSTSGTSCSMPSSTGG